jgi:cellulose synthase/poly-beta-1,6-N-acetylglucosamine synthase-like glycosyltransferase
MELPVHQQLTDMIYNILHILFIILFIYLSINIFYLLIASIAGRIKKIRSGNIHPVKKKIAVLITSHKEDEVIVNTARSASRHNYPEQYFDIYLAADQLKKSTIDELKKLRVNVSELNFPSGSKARSLNFLLNKINENEYDIALVLDGDNIMLPGFLEKINTAFQNGWRAVQAHRTAKNINTPVAILDAISEEINNHLFRKAQRVMGFSSSLIGSGMAFDFTKLKEVYNKAGILDNPACDREVDFEMMKEGIEVEYLEDAILLDEKVSSKNVFENQRRRWLESQALHLKLFFSKKENVSHKSKNYWNKLFINLLPPRIIFLGIFILIFLVCLIQLFSHVNITGISFSWWMILFSFYIISMIISTPARFLNAATAKAFMYLPSILFSFLKAGFTMRFSRKEFVHTPKTFTGGPGSTNN